MYNYAIFSFFFIKNVLMLRCVFVRPCMDSSLASLFYSIPPVARSSSHQKVTAAAAAASKNEKISPAGSWALAPPTVHQTQTLYPPLTDSTDKISASLFWEKGGREVGVALLYYVLTREK